jgi:hypothetical protein
MLVLSVAASADTPSNVVIGNSDNGSRYAFGLDPASGGPNSAFPDFATGGVYQQVYAGGAFPGPVTISQIAFADNAQLTSGPGTATYNITISLSTTPATANGLSTNMAANRGANFVRVFTGQVVANISDNDHFDLVVDITPFAFDPGAGTLTAAQDGSSDYNQAPNVSRTFAIADQPVTPMLISFGSSAYEVTERVGVVRITVLRSGDTSRPATVNYATDDTGASQDCSSSNGLATARCDFNAAVGTLDFAPGEVEKTFEVVINRDSRLEMPFESFTVKLSDPTGGAQLSTPANAIVKIDDASGGVPPGTNVIDDTRTFVRQQYHDFLNREPDLAGLNFWVDNIDQCDDPARRPADQTVARCKDIMRINTSAAFFLSIEFLQSGGLVHSFYAAALDRPNGMPGYTEFIRDSQAVGRSVVVGKAGWQRTLNDNRDVFMKDFVMRPEFVGLYPTTDTPAQFVEKLYVHAGITTETLQERADAIAEFGSAADASDAGARGRALLRITQNADFQAREINRNFVQMQYVGYLRRSPNDAPDLNFDGYDFWLKKVNSFNGNYVAADMVKAFLDSQEYRARFGP